MSLHNESAVPTGIGNGAVVSKAVVAQNYQNPTEIASKEYAAVKLANRFRLRIETARLVCQLSGLGGFANG
ncbi:hypothetical protein ACSBOB_00760 [Mesorhizobium sp. ASY16-5R]|uniref:hypothetical protein n=1 Tax=Mesorhizobium sp. ASY16-5R TaxID=3445772 RepID=UPI003FA18DD7